MKKILTPVVATPASVRPGSPVRRNAWPKMTTSAANSRSASKALSCFMFDNVWRRFGWKYEQPRGLAERLQQQVLHAPEIRVFVAQAKFKLLALVRDIERAKGPVPHRKTKAEILADMF